MFVSTRAPVKGATLDQEQRRPLKFPRGDLHLSDGKVLRLLIGYDLSKIPDGRKQGIIASRGWRDNTTMFIITAAVVETPRWGPLHRVAVSYPDHDPTWAELKVVRDYFFPADMDAAMLMPRAEDFVNLHPFCYHIWQLPEVWGMR